MDVRLSTCSLTVSKGQAAYARPDGGAARFDRVPDFLRDDPDPRPDSIPAPAAGLFAAQVTQEHPEEGLYVSVSDGVVALETQAGSVELGPGESGFSGSPQQSPIRLA